MTSQKNRKEMVKMGIYCNMYYKGVIKLKLTTRELGMTTVTDRESHS